MHSETLNGLLSVKPGNEPEQGETRTFVIEHRPARDGKKAWTKIKSAGADYGGTPYRILSAEPTGYTDQHGNISFNVEIEPMNGADAQPSNQPTSKPGSDPRAYLRDDPDRPPGAGTQPPTGVEETRRHIMQSANLYVLCVNAANKYVSEHMPEIAHTSEQFQAIVSTLFIEASHKRTNDGVNWWSYVDKMPDCPIK